MARFNERNELPLVGVRHNLDQHYGVALWMCHGCFKENNLGSLSACVPGAFPTDRYELEPRRCALKHDRRKQDQKTKPNGGSRGDQNKKARAREESGYKEG